MILNPSSEHERKLISPILDRHLGITESLQEHSAGDVNPAVWRRGG